MPAVYFSEARSFARRVRHLASRAQCLPLVLACCALQCGGLEIEDETGDGEQGSTSEAGSSGEAGSTTDDGSTGDVTSTGGGAVDEGPSLELHGACAEESAKHYCWNDEVAKGVQFCGAVSGVMQWGPCVRWIDCWPGEWRECIQGQETYDKECVLGVDRLPVWVDDYDTDGCGFTPLVLQFDARAPELAPAGAHAFDISGTGECLTTDWPGAATPWLVLDRDGDGSVADARELFGSAVVLRTGERARDGFAALAEHDDDGDGRITARDAVWSQLQLWSDHDGDRRSSPWELEPVAARGLAAIELAFRVDPRCDARGNCEVEQAGFTWLRPDGRAAAGTVVDLHLACQ